jgi:hypothetical protein
MLAALVITVGGYTRQISVFLVGGYGIAVGVRALKGELGKGRAVWTTALIGAVSCLGVLALVLWDRERAQAAGTMSYDQYLVDPDMSLLEQTIEGLRIRVSATGRSLIPGMHKAYARTGVWLNANVAIYAVVSVAILFGWWRLARRNLDPVLWMTPIYVVFFVFWPHSQSTRYWVPLLPVLLASLWGLIESRELSRRWRMRLVVLLIVAHALVSTGDWIKNLRHHQLHANWERFDALLAGVDPGPRELSGFHLDGDLSRILQVDQNVWIENPQKPEEIGGDVRWLIAPSVVPLPDGFVEAARFDTLKLLERRSSPP